MSPLLLVALSLAATPQAVGESSNIGSQTLAAAATAHSSPAEKLNAGVAATGATATSEVLTSNVATDKKDARTPAAWRREIRQALKRESSSEGGDRDAAVRQLLGLYRDLGQQTNLVETEQRQLRAQL